MATSTPDIDAVLARAENIENQLIKNGSAGQIPTEAGPAQKEIFVSVVPKAAPNTNPIVKPSTYFSTHDLFVSQEKEPLDVDKIVDIGEVPSSLKNNKRASFIAQGLQWIGKSRVQSELSPIPLRKQDSAPELSSVKDISHVVEWGEKIPPMKLISFMKVEENIVVADVDRVIEMAENVIRNSVHDLTGSFPDINAQ